MRRQRLLPAMVAIAAACAACGVPEQGTAREIQPSDVPYALLSPAPDGDRAVTSSGPAQVSPQLYLVDQNDLLVPTSTIVDAGGRRAVARQLLEQLEGGPTESQRDSGLASALGPGASLDLVGVSGSTATVDVSLRSGDPAANRLPLAVGQIVLSLASVEGVDRVQLVQDDEVVEVALPGGARTSEPVGVADYRSLLASQQTAQPSEPAPLSTQG